MVLTLFLVTLISSTAIGFVYEVTREPIREARMNKKSDAIRKVVPEFNNTPLEYIEKLPVEGDTLYFYKAMRDTILNGIAVESFSNKGFSGEIRIMVGFLPDGTIFDVSVLEHMETPGLGDRIEKEKSMNKNTGKSWSSQFIGKHPQNFTIGVKQDGGDVDAITAATISSRAFCDAVRKAWEGFRLFREESDNLSAYEPMEKLQ